MLGLALGVWNSGLGVSGLGFEVWDLESEDSGFGVQFSVFSLGEGVLINSSNTDRVWSCGIRATGYGFLVSSFKFLVLVSVFLVSRCFPASLALPCRPTPPEG